MESRRDNGAGSVFDLADSASYRRWREEKLDTAPRRLEDIMVELDDPRQLTAQQLQALRAMLGRCNMALYVGKTATEADKQIPHKLGQKLGLRAVDQHWLSDADGVSPLSNRSEELKGSRSDFIPYSDKPIKWHTDGYYNPPQQQIRAMLLHCVQSAASGGENQLLDHELAYIALRDENPEFIRALSAADAMTIPARQAAGDIARPDRQGPVFSVDATGALHMRYTSRQVSIVWRADSLTQAAQAALRQLLAAPGAGKLRGRLEPGMGIVCNNVLHDRSGFRDDARRQRLIYRIRYFDRIQSDLPGPTSL